MTDQPISLVERIADERVGKVVKVLEEALAEARAGEVEDVVVILLKRGGFYTNLGDGNASPLTLVGHLESVKYDILRMLDTSETK